jgi:hypothetical protein
LHKKNYETSIAYISAKIWFYIYLQDWKNLSYSSSNIYSKTWLRKEEPFSDTVLVFTNTSNFNEGENIAAQFYLYGSGINGSFSKTFSILNSKTLRFNTSITNDSCKPYLCFNVESFDLTNKVLICGENHTILANTPTIIESNFTNDITINQGEYFSIILGLNCTSPVSQEVKIYYNYTSVPSNIIVRSAKALEVVTTNIKNTHNESSYEIHPNQGANVTLKTVLNFNNTLDQSQYLYFGWIQS